MNLIAIILIVAGTALDLWSTFAFKRASIVTGADGVDRYTAGEFWWYRWLGGFWPFARAGFGLLALYLVVAYGLALVGIITGAAWIGVALWNFHQASALRRKEATGGRSGTLD